MKRVDPTAGEWIRPRLTGPWGSVTGVCPSGYTAYVRILHSVGGSEWGIHWRDVAAVTGRRVHPLVQWWRLIDADEPVNPTSTMWRNDEPVMGELPLHDALALYELLIGVTGTPESVYFGFWNGYSGNTGADTWVHAAHALWPTEQPTHIQRTPTGTVSVPGRDFEVVSGSLLHAPHIAGYFDRNDGNPPSPNIMWPADHTWFVASEIDFDSTIVGCTDHVAATILDNAQLEAYPVGPEDSLQYDADTINRR
ncbi:hypothetical protein SAMN05445060_3359 [Williamsia sterculiae]|uniref:Uncharacterized protein n=2 Tax=Williamsia sterculiae TaxID=1344003 RepID=A0A1N7H1C5_9NOCA|nr:hypothetical protein SAMN05445060_3359 [Williamsia sterculiae]